MFRRSCKSLRHSDLIRFLKKFLVLCPSAGAGRWVRRNLFLRRGYLRVFNLQIASALGTTATNPWNSRHAIMASAIYLSNLGALGSVGDNYTVNRTAACHYYSGQNCYKSNGYPSVGLNYGVSVMNIATCIQECDIDIINGVSTSCSASVEPQYCQ